jgi:hypothetical protein
MRWFSTSKRSANSGGGKALAPDLLLHHAHGIERVVAGFERAVGFQGARQIRRREQFAADLLEGGFEARQVAFAQRQAGGGGVAAEAQQQVGVALGDQVQRVAQVQAGDRAARAFSSPALPRGQRQRSDGAAFP